MTHYARHHSLTIILHWTTALAILVAVGAILLRELVEDDELRALLINLHRSLGVLILFLAAVRLVARLSINSQHIHTGLPRSIRLVSSAGHTALYAFLFALPITGWLLTNAEGKGVSPFGLFDLPILITRNRDLADQLGDFHETAAWVFIAVIGLHAGAALWHHFWRRDKVLRSMLPHWH